MRRTAALLILAACVSARTASADPFLIVHDFDGRAPGLQAYNEANLSLFTWASGTVATGVEIATSSFAVSSPNIVRGFAPSSGVLGRFVTTGTAQQLRLTTDVLFMEIVGPMDPASPWRLSIFDSDGSLIASQTSAIAQGAGFNRGSGLPRIASFLFEPGGPSQGLDDIRYAQAVVPEPSTVLLVGSGLAAVAWRRRRRAAA
jgi:hypothetical protein